MAATGLHIACTYKIYDAVDPTELNPLFWSENLTVPGTTTNSAPVIEWPTRKVQILEVTPFTSSCWVSTGPSPDATKEPRRFLAHNGAIIEKHRFAVEAGDKLAWIYG